MPDRSTCVEFGPELLEEAFGPCADPRDLGVPLSPRAQLLGFAVLRALREGRDRLAVEDSALELVRAVADDWAGASETVRLRASARRRVARARAFIASDIETNQGLDAVAQAATCSPYHLSRLFNCATGTTLRAYRRRLRVDAALQDLADGADNLSEVAQRVGFSDHSHMTSAFRTVYGCSPAKLRERLAGGAGSVPSGTCHHKI